MIVVDASVVGQALLFRGAAQERIADEWISAPFLVDVEVASMIRRHTLAGTIPPQRGREAVNDLVALDILRYGHAGPLPRVWELRDNLTAYDAMYVALAEALEVPLVTCDAKLAAAPGIQARVEVLPLAV